VPEGEAPVSDLTGRRRFYTKSFSILKTAGNEVYYTASSLLVTLKNSCSKLHSQKFFRLKSFSYKIRRCDAAGAIRAPPILLVKSLCVVNLMIGPS